MNKDLSNINIAITKIFRQFKIKMKDKFLEFYNFKIQGIMMGSWDFNKEIASKNLLQRFSL
jgi:hypothetical protein